jgi:hypothetical protein
LAITPACVCVRGTVTAKSLKPRQKTCDKGTPRSKLTLSYTHEPTNLDWLAHAIDFSPTEDHSVSASVTPSVAPRRSLGTYCKKAAVCPNKKAGACGSGLKSMLVVTD